MIHATVILDGDVVIGERVTIAAYAVITAPCTIGDDVYIGAHCVIGAPAQHHAHYPSPLTAQHAPKGVWIGEGATIREHSTIHQGLARETRVGAGVLIMASSHVAHDCLVGEGVTAAPFLGLGGFTTIGEGATLGQGVVSHPWIVIGEGSMVGLNTSVIRDVDAFVKVAGSPARCLGPNTPKLASRGADWRVRDAQIRSDRDELRSAWYGVAC